MWCIKCGKRFIQVLTGVLVPVDYLSLSDVYMKSIVLGTVEVKFKQIVKCCVILHMFVATCWGPITIQWAMKIINVVGWNSLKAMDNGWQVFLFLGREQQHDVVTTDFNSYLLCVNIVTCTTASQSVYTATMWVLKFQNMTWVQVLL